ncbi:hypothetical protein, partial [Brevibacterium antiquum]|uniref:hypothetical protein n=1 Tax=Brevibacterium antiquum TaxID=234835 RepID=UPI001C60A748
LRGAPFLNGNVDFEHHHFPSSEGAFPFHARLDPATRIGGSRLSALNQIELVANSSIEVSELYFKREL